jgi:outer membrane protein assembly factor BamB
MKSIIPKLFLSIFFCSVVLNIAYSQLYEWRGPDRSGIYNESGLLKKWPESGPKLVWEAENLGDGYSSPTITDNAVYV